MISLLATMLPWFVYGVATLSPFTTLDNPPPSVNGVVGEIGNLPYIVPAGYELVVTDMQVEGPAADYATNFSQFGMNLWLGHFPCTNAKGIVSCTTIGGSHQNSFMNLTLPPGTIVNIRLMNNTTTPWVNGWYLQGYLQSQ